MSQSPGVDRIMVILGNQLFDPKWLLEEKIKHVVMIEDISLCTYVKHHKQKILMFLSAMRSYRDELESSGIKVTYQKIEASLDLSKENSRQKAQTYATYFFSLKKILSDQGMKNLNDIRWNIFEIEDKAFEASVLKFFEREKISYTVHKSRLFICSRQDFKNYLLSSKKPFMKTFYEQQRKQRKILIDAKNKPVGGKWSFDSENRLKLPKNVDVPDDLLVKHTSHTKDLIPIVRKYFADHPGELESFNWPTTRDQAKQLVGKFFKDRLELFGPYEDAISQRSDSLFHSRLAAAINLGLIDPFDLVRKVESLDSFSLASREGFIRQVMGWREFIRGIYQNYSEEQEKRNFWNHTRKLKPCWYEANTGIEFLDVTIAKIQRTAYAHHIERLMMLSSTMLLLEVDPEDVYLWFMEMFIDSSEWVMVPNVYGMGQFADGGIFATKPYICGSNYLIKMSDYLKKGAWSDSMDALYWDFIGKHLDFYAKNPRMSVMVKQFEKFSSEKRNDISSRAEHIRNNLTFLE